MRKVACLIVLGLCSQTSFSVEVKPVVDAQIMGGQNYYNGSESSFGGVMSLTLSPYTKFNDQWSLVPLYAGNYRGTKQVTDIVGGGTLFQDSQSHTFSSKLIRAFSNGIKAKVSAGYGIELLRETKEEDWTKGLYDSRRLFAGPEVEWSWDNDRFVRAAYDHYRIRFPNYASLESAQVNSGLGRELSEPDVLNNTNHAFTVGSRTGLIGGGYGDWNLGFTLRQYADQHRVISSGDLESGTRHDNVLTLSGQGTWPVMVKAQKRLFSAFGYSLTRLHSDQNNYDTAQVRFNPNYYSYTTHSINHSWTLLLGPDEKTWALNINGALSRQSYSDRIVQDSIGTYGSDTTRVDSAYFGLGGSYPIASGFNLAAQAYFGWNDSNNHDNRAYQYHYNTQTYLMGFTYAY